MTFKPGAVTWNTDDPAHDTAPKKKGKKKARSPSPPAANPFGITPSLPSATQGIYLKKTEMRTTGACSASFTSTTFNPVTKNEFAMVATDKNPKKKGYVQVGVCICTPISFSLPWIREGGIGNQFEPIARGRTCGEPIFRDEAIALFRFSRGVRLRLPMGASTVDTQRSKGRV